MSISMNKDFQLCSHCLPVVGITVVDGARVVVLG